MVLTVERGRAASSEGKANQDEGYKTIRIKLPERNQTMFYYATGKQSVVGFNNNRPGVFEDSEGYGRVCAQLRQLRLWGMEEAIIYDCNHVRPESITHAVLDGLAPPECANCPLLYSEDKQVFCPARTALAAYYGRKALENTQQS